MYLYRLNESDDDDESFHKKRESVKVQNLRTQLKQLLSQRIMPKSAGGRYITGSVMGNLADSLLLVKGKITYFFISNVFFFLLSFVMYR